MQAATIRGFKSVTHALYQARMWREYARTFDGVRTSSGVGVDWVTGVMLVNRRYCLDRAWEAVRAAKHLQTPSGTVGQVDPATSPA